MRLTISSNSRHWHVYRNCTHSFNDLLHDLREYPILACVRVLPSGRNYRRLPFCVHQLTSLQTHRIECVSSLAYSNILDRVHWVIYLQHQLVALVDSRVWPSTVDAVSVSSYIGPTVINDPARVPEHDILAVSTGVKTILADLGSTCKVLLSPAALTLLVDWDQYFTVLFIQSLVITPARSS